jgi:hypothetical protein
MRDSITKSCAALATALLLGGCIHAAGGIAPSNVPLEGRPYHVLGPVAASDSAVRLFMFIPVSGSNDTATAVREALIKSHADALIEVTVENYSQYWILFSRHITSVRATAIQFDREPARGPGHY